MSVRIFRISTPAIIVGADIFYDTADHENILATISYFFEQLPSCVFYTVVQKRRETVLSTVTLQEWSLTAHAISTMPFLADGDDKLFGGTDLSDLQMLEIRPTE